MDGSTAQGRAAGQGGFEPAPQIIDMASTEELVEAIYRLDEAKAAVRRGAEALVVQGSEAGGHNRAWPSAAPRRLSRMRWPRR